MSPPAPLARNVILIGYRGSGKTTVAQDLAAALDWPVVDTDRLIEAAAGKSIRSIFADDGEPHFRELETAAVERAVRGRQQVISVGGGAVERAQNRRMLARAGVTLWLTASPAALHERMQADPRNAATRPALTAHDAHTEIEHLLARRSPLYAALANHVLDTTGRGVDAVVREALHRLHVAVPKPEPRHARPDR